MIITHEKNKNRKMMHTYINELQTKIEKLLKLLRFYQSGYQWVKVFSVQGKKNLLLMAD